ncbi:MAG: tetratricopeptide repeat protein [Solirubrobacteraceae bacterium]
MALMLTAGSLAAISFGVGGGLELQSMTVVEIALTLASGAFLAGVLVAVGLGRVRAPQRLYGVWPGLLMVAFAALTALSVTWSVEPDSSWQDAGRMLAYTGLFASAIVLARIAPGRWATVLGGVTLAAVLVSGYALLTKVFPAALDASDTYARLQQPYGYWIATGLGAAIGVVGCVWLAARRDGHALLRALAYPAMGLLLATLLLTYSRGPLAALLVGLAVWFVVVPLRLRGATVLIAGAIGAIGPVMFEFSNHALSSENIPLGERSYAGTQFGVLLIAMLIALTALGLAIGFMTDRQAPSAKVRRRYGGVLLAVLATGAVLLVGALAVSHRGLSGTIAHDWNSLTNPNASGIPNGPGRLTAIASVRARYWDEALHVFAAHPVAGAGAAGYATARLRYRTGTLDVRHAHGFIVQTLADLGVVGLVIVLALLLAWALAARRASAPLRRDLPYTPERVGLLSMLTIVIVFGVHSLVDWTWYVPGNACAALLLAGWLAGRGPLFGATPAAAGPAGSSAAPALPDGARQSIGSRQLAAGRGRGAWGMRAAWHGPAAVAVLCAALLAAYSEWQPERSESASQRALALAGNQAAARREAEAAISEDPLSANALAVLASVQERAGEQAAAEVTLRRAVAQQPSNPRTWAALGEHDLERGNYSAAVNELRAAVYLNPQAIASEATIAGQPNLIALRNAYLEALRATGTS